MQRIGRLAGIGLVIITAGLMAAQPAQADGGIVTTSFICGASNYMLLDYKVLPATSTTEATARVEGGGGYSEASFLVHSGYGAQLIAAVDTSGSASALATAGGDPDGTAYVDASAGGATDVLMGTLLVKEGGVTVIHTQWILDCNDLPVREINLLTGKAKGKDAPYTGIFLLSQVEQALYLNVPNSDGVNACGVFDVNGWGRKYIGLADFPNCTPPDLTVMCFDDMGGWTADNVKDVYIRPDGAELDFTSSQHGICGIFPIG
jgi:hypothetical protein